MSESALVVEENELLEREEELARLGAALASAAAGRGCVIHVEGPAGIGKTGLLDAARAAAGEQGLAVLAARGGELEREFAHGIVRDLFERRLVEASAGEKGELLAGSAALARPALGLGGAGLSAAETSGAVTHGLYWLVANLAARRPLLLAVDDAHWADRASLRFLAHLAARIEELPVVLVSAARPREPGCDRAALEALAAAAAGPNLIRPRALSVAATAAVVGGRIGCAVDDEFAAACHGASGGNPFLVRELAGALRADGSRGAAAEASLIRDLGPNTVSRSLLLRLTAMPPAAGAIAAAVAVLGNDVELHHAAEFAAVELGEAALAIDSLAGAEILAPELPLNFVHPIVRSAVYADLGPGERAAAHARAARLLAANGAAPELIAPHVIHCAPAGERRFVELLREAAAAALGRGAPDTAAAYLRRAREEDEAARADGELLCELGTAEYLAGEEPERAAAHLAAGIRLVADPERRAEAWLVLGRTRLSQDVLGAVEVLEAAVEDLEGFEGELKMRLQVELNCIGVTHAESFQRSAARIDALAEVRGETPAERLVLCNAAYRAGLAGTDLERTTDYCRRALGGGRLIAEEGAESSAITQVLYTMYMTDMTSEALRAAGAGLERAIAHGSAWGFISASGVRGALNYLAGDLRATEADNRQALELPGCPPFAVPFCSAFLALALVERGELEEADAVVAAGGCGPQLPPIIHMELLLWARSRLRAAQGRDAEALADLVGYGERCEKVGAHLPGIPWRGDLALVHRRLGDEEGARRCADEQLRRAREWGAKAVLGQALVVSGLVEGGAGGLERLEEAVALLAGSPARLEHARALVEHGAARRRAGQRTEARERLREGLEAARRCGATALVDRAHAELVTAGARPRRLMFSGVEALTASESRVAALAAEGMGNREIAQSLFVTVKTVENHLGRAYAKLGIHSREELPAALAGDPGA